MTLADKNCRLYTKEAGMMKDRRFWPEQKEEAKSLAVKERKLLTMEYDASLDADSLRVLTKEEYEELKGGYYASVYAGWITVIEDHTEKTGKAWEVLRAVNKRFRELDAEEQTIDVLNDFSDVELGLADITDDFISYMRASGHKLTYSLPMERGCTAYFIVTSRACLEDGNIRMMMAEAAMV